MATRGAELRYGCPDCGKTFARQAHLERHQDTHRASFRWSCPQCESSYTRRDALNRHLARCSAGTSDLRISSGRVNRACQGCSSRKVRCSRGQPCQRCAELKVSCHYLVHKSARRTSMPLFDSGVGIPDTATPAEMSTSGQSLGDSSTSDMEAVAFANILREQRHTSVAELTAQHRLPEPQDPEVSGRLERLPHLDPQKQQQSPYESQAGQEGQQQQQQPPTQLDTSPLIQQQYPVGAEQQQQQPNSEQRHSRHQVNDHHHQQQPLPPPQPQQQSQEQQIQHDQRFFSESGDGNPWLSWEWMEPHWDVFDSIPSMHTIMDPDLLFDSAEVSTQARNRISTIVDAKIDPVEQHRQKIIAFLHTTPEFAERRDKLRWLVRAEFPQLLKTYFLRHHRHTPIIHLPTFNICTCPTSLVFALTLIAASYTPTLGLRAKDIVVFSQCAQRFALLPETYISDDKSVSLEALQALILLAILDRLMVKRPPGSKYSIDLSEIARLARDSNIFRMSNDPPEISWFDWARRESRRRLGLVLFAFDSFISVLHDEMPNVRTDELDMRFPAPEFMFMAASEQEWRDTLTPANLNAMPPCSVSLILSSLFCNVEQPAPLPPTLMGRFVLLHGILQHAWRTKRVLLENALATSDPALAPYLASKMNAIHSSLRKWRDGWPENLLDFEPFPESPSLYQDRAEACWFLAGIMVLPYVAVSSPRSSKSINARPLSIQQYLERLMVLSDQGRLHAGTLDFDATYNLLVGPELEHVGNNILGTMIYREADTTTAGFDE